MKEKTAKLVASFGKSAMDSGSTEAQIALITHRINDTLAPHFKKHVKDHHSKQGLLKLVGQRRRLLKYLKASNETSYNEVLVKLELRK